MKTLNQLLLKKNSKKIAIIDQETHISYELLNHLSDQWANELMHHQKVQVGEVVIIKMSKSWRSIVAMLAVNKARAVYVILDPLWPMNVVNKIIQDCKAKIILENMPTNFNHINISLVKLPVLEERDLCYIYYTSGSTGEKKGASFDHKRAMNFIKWAQVFFQFSSMDKVACLSPLSFDVCVLDVFATFNAGATLVIVPDQIKLFQKNVKDYLRIQEVSVIQTVPSFWEKIVDINLPTLKKLIFTGQSISKKFYSDLHSNCDKNYPKSKFYNLYGQTEANSYLCYAFEKEFPVPIAKLPLPNYVFMREGQLWIKGHSLMRNYLGYDEIVEYNTGDLVSVKNDQLFLEGRWDNLIKYKGYRISLEEVEKILNQVVNASCVFFDGKLHAVVESPKDITRTEIEEKMRSYCKQYLASYQIPEKFIVVDELLKNPNGKIDRKKIKETFSEKQNDSIDGDS